MLQQWHNRSNLASCKLKRGESSKCRNWIIEIRKSAIQIYCHQTWKQWKCGRKLKWNGFVHASNVQCWFINCSCTIQAWTQSLLDAHEYPLEWTQHLELCPFVSARQLIDTNETRTASRTASIELDFGVRPSMHDEIIQIHPWDSNWRILLRHRVSYVILMEWCFPHSLFTNHSRVPFTYRIGECVIVDAPKISIF